MSTALCINVLALVESLNKVQEIIARIRFIRVENGDYSNWSQVVSEACGYEIEGLELAGQDVADSLKVLLPFLQGTFPIEMNAILFPKLIWAGREFYRVVFTRGPDGCWRSDFWAIGSLEESYYIAFIQSQLLH